MGTCTIDDCHLAVRARGWCASHYGRWDRYGDPLGLPTPRKPKHRACQLEGCGIKHHGGGYCSAHLQRWKMHGDPYKVVQVQRADPEQVFTSNTTWRDGCLIWVGGVGTHGYGTMRVDAKPVLAHRYAYERAKGPIPKGLVVDHKCFNKACVNVAHLRLVTPKQNNENKPGPNSNNTSGYRGVFWRKDTQKWFVSVGHGGRLHNGGTFTDRELANEAAVALRLRLHTHNDLDRN